MSKTEYRGVTLAEMIQEVEQVIRQQLENKYDFQVGLKDLDFDINEDQLRVIGLHLPFKNIDQAEQALRNGAISPITFIEHDETEHQVLIFDHGPVGFSGFMDCVTHSLALTNHGLFEVGRYPAMNLSAQNRYWQWFLHRRLASVEEVNSWCESSDLSSEQFMENVYLAMKSG